MATVGESLVPMGRIGAPHGVRGWVRIQSETRPEENILAYTPWYLRAGHQGAEARPVTIAESRIGGKGPLARLDGVADREGAAALTHSVILVPRSALPEPPDGEWYWADLEGLAVVTTADEELGRVQTMMETGANDVMVVAGERERLIPFVQGEVVRSVEPEAGRVVVDWDPEF
ncbi:16S rRNA processing protein RimM [Thiohalospira halophila DSM 15071]|uniref:Ribosome maturation factor RimM n=1 Tax=Thiohalospira halophila DSM 15071 TaxID=1123397 RepID=A0A1I1UE52_9GAMM|nr:ribosome maturation factor RimM [Thiohalospira halophila]SFD69101.1 16S rRNA processing protein RimM [Thiohalospira halophila DSM 15071]